jgi:hypothetical protein
MPIQTIESPICKGMSISVCPFAGHQVDAVSMTPIRDLWLAGSPSRTCSWCAFGFGCPLGLRPIQQRVPRAVVGPKRVIDDPLALEDELADPTIGAGIVNNE